MYRSTQKPRNRTIPFVFVISILGLMLAAVAFICTLIGWSRFGLEEEIGLTILIGVIAFNVISVGINLFSMIRPKVRSR